MVSQVASVKKCGESDFEMTRVLVVCQNVLVVKLRGDIRQWLGLGVTLGIESLVVVVVVVLSGGSSA